MAFTGPHYTDPSHWTPRHYGDELFEQGDDGRDPAVHLFDFQIDFTDQRACYRAMVRCPGCDRRRIACCVVDTRHLPDAVTGGQPWACEACWGGWIRPDGWRGRIPRRQRLSEAEWQALHGAPKSHVNQMRQVVQRRKARGWNVDHRVPGVVDLDALTDEADDPRTLSWPEPATPPTARGGGS